ncbi:MAG: hypothetical protein GY869_18310 [Planctomycetes bacterium]|nr:hypothetical protein [Planctomycetota bacterium]
MNNNHVNPSDDIPIKSLIGKTLYVEMNCYTVEQTFLAQKQFFGEVISANEDKGLVLNLSGHQAGRIFFIPYDVRGYLPAPPGEYHIQSTGETIKNPDFKITWNTTARSPI